MSRILIDEGKLRLILEKHSSEIGKKADFSNAVAAATFTVSCCIATYENWWILPGWLIKASIVTIASLWLIWSVLMTCINKKSNFDHEVLFEEIKEQNEIKHPFSLVSIKDTFNDYPNKYLLYYDKRWRCWFFFNYKTIDDEENNIQNMKSKLSFALKIGESNISISYKTEKLHSKFSVSDNEMKVYEHKLYEGVISNPTDDVIKTKFDIDGVQYKWMTIAEMEADPVIQKKNADVVEFVKQNT